MANITQLTDNSWLVKGNNGYSGLLFKILDKFLFLSSKQRLEFDTIDDVTKKFGPLEETAKTDSTKLENINGYPLKHSSITVISQKPPLYTKGTNLTFCAGYWAIRMQSAWVLAFCPKEKTTIENEAVGPFRNRIEALNQVSMLNSKKIIEERRG